MLRLWLLARLCCYCYSVCVGPGARLVCGEGHSVAVLVMQPCALCAAVQAGVALLCFLWSFGAALADDTVAAAGAADVRCVAAPPCGCCVSLRLPDGVSDAASVGGCCR